MNEGGDLEDRDEGGGVTYMLEALVSVLKRGWVVKKSCRVLCGRWLVGGYRLRLACWRRARLRP